MRGSVLNFCFQKGGAAYGYSECVNNNHFYFDTNGVLWDADCVYNVQ